MQSGKPRSTESWNGKERRRAAERKHQERRIWLQTTAIVALIVAIWASAYQGRMNLVDAQRRDCERTKLDRRANAQGWRTAEAARRVTAEAPLGPRGPSPVEQRAAKLAATRYRTIADGLDRRSLIDCTRIFPKPKLVELD